ncbi:MAG: hypothetical protein RL172_798 [Bacteroidota bacterium]|jgi:hypothetical protein
MPFGLLPDLQYKDLYCTKKGFVKTAEADKLQIETAADEWFNF